MDEAAASTPPRTLVALGTSLDRAERGLSHRPWTTAESDHAGLHHFANAVRLQHLEHGLELRWRASDLDAERLRTHIDYLRMEQLGGLDDPMPRVLVSAHFHEEQLALHRLVLLELDDLQHIDELVQLFRHLLEGAALDADDDRHARQPRMLGRTDGERLDVESTPAEQSRHAGEYARLVLDENGQGVPGHRSSLAVEDWTDASGRDDVVIARARCDHWPDHRVFANSEVDDDRLIINGHRLFDGRIDLGLGLAPHTDAPQRFGQSNEVRNRVLDLAGLSGGSRPVRAEIGIGVPLLIEEGLPLPNHAQVAVVDHGNLDRDSFDRAGRQLLVRHLEAPVTIDGPYECVRTADLCAHRRRHRISHRSGAARVQPLGRLLVRDELRRPHLMLPNAGNVDRVRSAQLADALDHVLRREAPIGGVVVAERIRLRSEERR